MCVAWSNKYSINRCQNKIEWSQDVKAAARIIAEPVNTWTECRRILQRFFSENNNRIQYTAENADKHRHYTIDSIQISLHRCYRSNISRFGGHDWPIQSSFGIRRTKTMLSQQGISCDWHKAMTRQRHTQYISYISLRSVSAVVILFADEDSWEHEKIDENFF